MEKVPDKEFLEEKAKILIVDDDILVTKKIYSQYFAKKRLGLIFYFSENGINAIEFLEKNDIAVLITDLMMPDMDGLTLLKKLQEKRLFIPSIVLTGYGTEESRVQAKKLGAVRLLDKPAKLSHILLAIQEALETIDKQA